MWSITNFCLASKYGDTLMLTCLCHLNICLWCFLYSPKHLLKHMFVAIFFIELNLKALGCLTLKTITKLVLGAHLYNNQSSPLSAMLPLRITSSWRFTFVHILGPFGKFFWGWCGCGHPLAHLSRAYDSSSATCVPAPQFSPRA